LLAAALAIGISLKAVVAPARAYPVLSNNDCPATILISAYPPGIGIISPTRLKDRFRANFDTFGNHANGIQLSRGSMTVYAMHEEDPYSWGLHFCLSRAREHGANCLRMLPFPASP
jgi:hypothetical protein